MKTIKTKLIIFCFFIIYQNVSGQKTIPLFNGKNLKGWHTDIPGKDINPDTPASFIVRNGMLVSLGTPKGHLITDKVFSNYILEAVYRFPSKPGNAGILVHSSTPRVLYQMFPKSIEVQMQHKDAGDFWCIEEDITVSNMEERRGPKEKWGASAGMLRRIKNLTNNSERPLGDWNTIQIECIQDKIRVWVNDDLVNEGYNCTTTKGQIALQAEGSEVEFKSILLNPIK